MTQGKGRKTTPAAFPAATTPDGQTTGNDAVMVLLQEVLVVAKRAEAGVNLMNTRLGELEKDVGIIKQSVRGVMELGGSVLDAKEQMSKSLRKVGEVLHALTKAQVRTYNLIQKHAALPHDDAHAVRRTKATRQ